MTSSEYDRKYWRTPQKDRTGRFIARPIIKPLLSDEQKREAQMHYVQSFFRKMRGA